MEQIMSADKYPSIFSRQMEAIVHTVTFMNMTHFIAIKSHKEKGSQLKAKHKIIDSVSGNTSITTCSYAAISRKVGTLNFCIASRNYSEKNNG